MASPICTICLSIVACLTFFFLIDLIGQGSQPSNISKGYSTHASDYCTQRDSTSQRWTFSSACFSQSLTDIHDSMHRNEDEIANFKEKIEALQPTIHNCMATQLRKDDILAKSYSLLERLEMAGPSLGGHFFTILRLRVDAKHVDKQVDMESTARLRGLELHHKEQLIRTDDLFRECRLVADIVEAICPMNPTSSTDSTPV